MSRFLRCMVDSYTVSVICLFLGNSGNYLFTSLNIYINTIYKGVVVDISPSSYAVLMETRLVMTMSYNQSEYTVIVLLIYCQYVQSQ